MSSTDLVSGTAFVGRTVTLVVGAVLVLECTLDGVVVLRVVVLSVVELRLTVLCAVVLRVVVRGVVVLVCTLGRENGVELGCNVVLGCTVRGVLECTAVLDILVLGCEDGNPVFCIVVVPGSAVLDVLTLVLEGT